MHRKIRERVRALYLAGERPQKIPWNDDGIPILSAAWRQVMLDNPVHVESVMRVR